MDPIFHITLLSEWQNALEDGIYHASSLAGEGFMHCSTREQVASSANRHFSGRKGLVLLHIDPTRAESEVRYENTSGGVELFPHIYGPLNLEAVIRVETLDPFEDGLFHY